MPGGTHQAGLLLFGLGGLVRTYPGYQCHCFGITERYHLLRGAGIASAPHHDSGGVLVVSLPWFPLPNLWAEYSISASRGDFQPTNTIVDFFVQDLQPTYGKFRINYEDVEQGADHDMDAIIIYEYQVLDAAGDPVGTGNLADGVKVKITLTSEYAAGSIIQHCGYIISGTTADGTYLEVRDIPDNVSTPDPDYFLDTPPGVGPNGGVADTAWDDNAALPFTAERTFVPNTGAGTAAGLLKNPLWYAAKWGGFEDANDDKKPDGQTEWDKDEVGEEGHGVPDTYFYVTNPLRLEEQLNESFANILERAAAGNSASVLATNSEGEGNLVQAYFRPTHTYRHRRGDYLAGFPAVPVGGSLRQPAGGQQRQP